MRTTFRPSTRVAMYETLSDILNDSKVVYSDVNIDDIETTEDTNALAEVIVVYNDRGYGPMMGADLLVFINSGLSVESCLEQGFDWVEENYQDDLQDLIAEEMSEKPDSDDYEGDLMEAEEHARETLHESVMYIEFTDMTNGELLEELFKVTNRRNIRELGISDYLPVESRGASTRRRSAADTWRRDDAPFRSGEEFERELLETFTRGYIEAALWSTNDESTEQGGDPLDQNYSPEDIAPEAMEKIRADCKKFYTENYDDIQLLEQDPRSRQSSVEELAGFEFWLTRNGHGTGFWDADMDEEARDRLTAAAERFGEFDLIVGDDGLIHS